MQCLIHNKYTRMHATLVVHRYYDIISCLRTGEYQLSICMYCSRDADLSIYNIIIMLSSTQFHMNRDFYSKILVGNWKKYYSVYELLNV